MEAILQQTRRWDLPLIEQGRAQGLEQGLERGRAEGEARTLRRQLSMKFGNLPSTMDERISVATTKQLETWLDRVLTAESLAAVFAE
jgi:flagellar biosynthesis/type III secretory pathway protein FliH